MENQNKMRCANCDVCCRFLDEETPLAPVGLSLIPYKDRFICRNFDPRHNRCENYKNRPLDCHLYPLVVMWDEKYRHVVLGLDHKCPQASVIASEPQASEAISKKERSLRHFVPRNDNLDSRYIMRFQDDIEVLERLDIKVEPALNKLLIGDKALFEKYAGQADRPLSSYSFIANYVWTGLLDYYWMITDDNFCLFCRTRETMFMPIPPMGARISPAAVKKCFELMYSVNKNKDCSRIEDVCEKDAAFYSDLEYKVREKGWEYIYDRGDLTKLAGDQYKDKRALCNYFMKHCKYEYREFRPSDKKACLELYELWAMERGTVPNDRRKSRRDENCPHYYTALLEDSRSAHKKAMDRFADLGLAGRIVIVDNKTSAYTFGYPLDNSIFVVLLEVADLKIKGLSQFIFRRFCEELDGYKYINAMDDSGLENLKKVKMSYRPVKIERTYCVHA
jgi:hypothetical protein